MRLIGLAGYARSGKDSLADYFVATQFFTKRSFAEPMREALYRLNPTIDVQGYRASLRQAVDLIGWEDLKKVSADLRPLLQRFGTEVGRNMWGQDFWVNQLMGSLQGDTVIADVRFKNEADAVKNAGGVVWRVERPGVTKINNHISETELDGYDFDAVLVNDGTLPDLYAKAYHLAREAK